MQMQVKKAIVKAITKASGQKEVNLEVPTEANHGDFSTNVALVANLEAKKIVNKLSKDSSLKSFVSKIEKAGPGFVNFWLSEEYLQKNLKKILDEKDKYGSQDIGKDQTVVIDYSSPNIAKRFSIGHLRSTIIGQALYNLYSFLGYKIIGDNHLGDWGTQFGALVYMVESRKLDPNKLTVSDWEKLYVEFHRLADENEGLKDKARSAFKRLEEGDASAKAIWQAAYNTSIKEYKKIYQELGVNIDFTYGESFYEDKMAAAIKKAKEKGILKKSQGAWVVDFDKKYKLPTAILVKSNGATTYLTRDLALMFFRKKEWNPDLQIFEVGADQKLYFKQVFALAEMMGLFTLGQLHHVAHGMIRLKEGKMSTRRGRNIKLENVLSEAVSKASRLGAKDEKTAKMVGIGAVKWNDLRRDPEGDYVFDWEDVLNMQGNSGPYLQYTFARTQSVLAKSKVGGEVEKGINFSPEELALLRSFAQFSGIICDAAKNYSPNLLCEFLYDLAQKYNSFYNKHKIIGSENERFRLAVTAATGQILQNGLKLLGIETPEKM